MQIEEQQVIQIITNKQLQQEHNKQYLSQNTWMNTKIEICSLTEQQLLKIFPHSYYQKYANHLKILEFQKIIVEDDETKKSHINFKPRNKKYQERIKSAIPKQQNSRVKINHFDTFQDKIDKNKLQLRRMSKYNAVLGLKMKLSPQKRNVIRSPIKNQNNIQQSTLLQMKAIQDMQFQKKQQLRQQIKINIEKQSICKFVKRSKSALNSERKRSSTSSPQDTKHKIKTQRNLAIRLSQIAMVSLQRNSSIYQSNGNLNSKNASYISNVNNAIRKSQKTLRHAPILQSQQQNILKLFKKRTLSKSSLGFMNDNEKKDLIQQTKKIKQQVMMMPILKRTDPNLLKQGLLQEDDKINSRQLNS